MSRHTDRKLIVAFLLSLLAVILVATSLLQRNVAVEAYSERLGLLNEAAHLDARMNEDMQSVLAFQLLHYDSLVEITSALEANTALIVSSEKGLRGTIDSRQFDDTIDGYQQAVKQKILLLERIKSKVALLRNSLQYLPGLIEELATSSSQGGQSIERGLLTTLMNYNLFPGRENQRQLLEKIKQIRASLQAGQRSEDYEHLLLHLNNNLKLRTQIDELVVDYAAQTNRHLLEDLRQVYNSSYQIQSTRFYYVSILLFAVLFMLLIGLGYLLRSLQRARKASEQAWQQLHDALESISEAFVLFDPFDRLVLWNRKYAELYPSSTKLLAPGTTFADLAQVRVSNGEYPPDELEHLQLSQLLQHHRNMEKPEVETLANGKHYLVSNSRTSIGGIASVYIDITERNKTEEQLRIAAAVFDASSEGIVVTDHNNRIIAVNPGFTKITGYLLDEVVGKPPNILSSGRHDADFYRDMWQSLQHHDCWEGEIWNRNKYGEVYAEWLSLTLVRNESGDVVQHIAVFSDITKRKRDEEKIRWQANYDVITGLPNRTLFLERLSASISSSHREEWTTALLFIDLDHFKTVNDTRGHATGDWLLQEVAGRLAGCIREADTVARLGGDEFTIILQDITGADDAAKMAKKIVSLLSEPFYAEGGDIFIGASIGITLYPNDGEDSDTLIRNADLAMYRAKEAGRNGYRFFTQSMNDQMLERARTEDAMRYALKGDEFFLEFQPIVDSRSGKVVKAESLVRWQHPDRGRVTPVEFISIAEDSGLIAPLGWWIIEQACQKAAEWHEMGLKVGVSVNVSARQIKLGLSVDDLVNLLETLSLPPERLTLEITETLLMEETEKTLAWLRRVRKAGIKLSVDDFGTGFSSLSYLKRFPVNSLKIDQGFVRDVNRDPEDAALVRAIISMAETFGLDVIAEGVEQGEQLDFLEQHGCYLIQGYYYSRPLGNDAFVEFVERRSEGEVVPFPRG